MANVTFSKPAKKTGKKSWRPAPLLQVTKKDANDDSHLYWADIEQGNLQKKLSEGWTFVDRSEVNYAVPDAATILNIPTDESVEGSTVKTGQVQFRDVVLMKMDDETWQARKEYFDELTDARDIPDNETFKQRTKQIFEEEGSDVSVITD